VVEPRDQDDWLKRLQC